jgi:hypothetical protein
LFVIRHNPEPPVAKKKFALKASQIKPLAEGHGGCFATDMITVEGRKVGYMYREKPDTDFFDSGWRFMSGDESQAYMNDAANTEVYDVNTIANYDPDIIPFLDAPTGSAFERQGRSRKLIQIKGKPWDPKKQKGKLAKKWPPPGFPLVKGDHALTEAWSIHLPERFARRVEDESLVLWRPGLTLWLSAWDNDRGESQAKRLAWIKKSASRDRFDEHEAEANNLTRFHFRLHADRQDGAESLYAFVIGDDGHLQMSVYFDDPADVAKAHQLVNSVVERNPS